MTAIVGILNTHGVAIAADSATTFSSSDNNVQKVHNKANKIFALSKKYSIGIAIYNTASFMDIPWEIIIKTYRKQLQENVVFNTVDECKNDFLTFLQSYTRYVTLESKENVFVQHYISVYNEITNWLRAELADNQLAIDGSADKLATIQDLVNHTFSDYKLKVEGYIKNPDFTLTFDDFENAYPDELTLYINALTETIGNVYPGYNFTEENITNFKEILHGTALWEFIYEDYSGLVFIGFGEEEIFPSSHLVLIGNLIHNTVRHRIMAPIIIKPGISDGNIIPYAQSDVTFSVLRGIDPTVEGEMNKSIKSSFDALISYMQPKFTDGDEEVKIKALADGLIKQIQDYNYDKITSPILKMLHCMDKEDMADLAESLVNITSLRRKFSETNESVGGPIDVAIITKGDGFIWTKRKKYFESEVNKNI